MSKVMFDTRNGFLLIGEAAIATQLEQSAPGDIVGIGSLVVNQEFPYKNGDYDLLDTTSWEPSEYRDFGYWVINILKNSSKNDSIISRDIIERFRILGLGPSIARIKKMHISMGEYRESLGQNKGHFPNQYKDWTHNDYVQYADRLQGIIGRVPTYEDYQQAARDEIGPSATTITDVYGGVRWLNETIGQPNIYEWEPADFVDWGVEVVKTNGGCKLTARLLNVLSKKKLGPSASTVAAKIGINNLNDLVFAKIDTNNAIIKNKIDKYRQMIEKGSLPVEFGELTDEQLISRSAKYFVAKRCLTSDIGLMISEQRLYAIGRSSTKNFVNLIQASDPSISAGFIERVADDWGLFDDVWPPKKVDKRLKLDPKELGYRRRGNADRHFRANL